MNVIQDCKYMLPCGWCDKYNRFCNMVESIKIGVPISECKHNWITEKAEAVTKEEAGCTTYYTLRCSICGKKRIKRVEVSGDHKFNITIWELKT